MNTHQRIRKLHSLLRLKEVVFSSLQVFVVFRGVVDQDNGTVEIPIHPRSHDHEVPPQVSHPEKLGLEGEHWTVLL